MAILNLEEINNQTYDTKNILKEAQAINKLDADICQIDNILKGNESYSDQDLKNIVFDMRLNLETYSNQLIGCTGKDLMSKTNISLSHENIFDDNEHSLEVLKRNLLVIKNNISQEAVNKVKVGIWERIKNQFKTVRGEYKDYKEKSEKLLSDVKTNNFNIIKGNELDNHNLIYLSELPYVCCKNLISFYKDGIKNNSVVSLQSNIKDIKLSLNGQKINDGMGPIGIDNAPNDNMQVRLAPTGRELKFSDTWILTAFKDGVIAEYTGKSNFSSVKEVVDKIQFLDQDMKKCFDEIEDLATSWTVKMLDFLDVTNLGGLAPLAYIVDKTILAIFSYGNLNNLVHCNYHWVRQHAAQKALMTLLERA